MTIRHHGPGENAVRLLSPRVTGQNRYTRGMGTRSLGVSDGQRALMATISAEMDERGISIRALASDLGISHTRLAYVLRNERAVTYDEVAAMCSLLGLSLWRLLRQIEIERASDPRATPSRIPHRPASVLGMLGPGHEGGGGDAKGIAEAPEVAGGDPTATMELAGAGLDAHARALSERGDGDALACRLGSDLRCYVHHSSSR